MTKRAEKFKLELFCELYLTVSIVPRGRASGVVHNCLAKLGYGSEIRRRAAIILSVQKGRRYDIITNIIYISRFAIQISSTFDLSVQ